MQVDDGLLSIGQVSAATGVAVSALRYYETVGSRLPRHDAVDNVAMLPRFCSDWPPFGCAGPRGSASRRSPPANRHGAAGASRWVA